MRRKILAAAVLLASGLSTTSLVPAHAAGIGGATAAPQATQSLVQEVRRAVRGPRGGVRVVRPGARVAVTPGRRVYVKKWRHRPHYGTIIGGVVLGTVIAAAVANAAPPPPAPGLCWNWSNPSHTRGYWDYCY